MTVLIEEYLVESATSEYARNVWLIRGEAGVPKRLCVFLDAEFYINRVDAPAILTRLQNEGSIPPVTCVFVSNLDDSARHQDFACSLSYSRFIAEDVVSWAKAKVDGIGQEGYLVCGLSLSGLASAFLTLAYPAAFPLAISQSGSFWWNEGWFAKNAASFPAARRKCWMSVGDQETASGISHPPSGMLQEESQIVGVKNAVGALEAIGATVKFHEFAGGHEIARWADELPNALQWVFQS